MKLHFRDQPFSCDLLRAANYGLYDGSEIGEVLATAHRIHEGDFESWNLEWSHVAERIETLAKMGNMTLPHQVLFDWLDATLSLCVAA